MLVIRILRKRTPLPPNKIVSHFLSLVQSTIQSPKALFQIWEEIRHVVKII